MTANRLKLVGPSVLIFIATAEAFLAQNTRSPMLSGNTVNPHGPSFLFLRRFPVRGCWAIQRRGQIR